VLGCDAVWSVVFVGASKQRGNQLKVRLMGGIRKELILSPYSSIYLKPYIRRDTETYPAWLRLMAEVQMKANEKNTGYVLPPRAPIDYTYVQPEHIPAINSLCNNFFWSGIDRNFFFKPYSNIFLNAIIFSD
jgi:hypothetical protein